MAVIVLVTEGKSDGRPDYATVRLFGSSDEAAAFVAATEKGGKYWTKAEIVGDDEKVELYSPELY